MLAGIAFHPPMIALHTSNFTLSFHFECLPYRLSWILKIQPKWLHQSTWLTKSCDLSVLARPIICFSLWPQQIIIMCSTGPHFILLKYLVIIPPCLSLYLQTMHHNYIIIIFNKYIATCQAESFIYRENVVAYIVHSILHSYRAFCSCYTWEHYFWLQMKTIQTKVDNVHVEIKKNLPK